MTVASCAGKHTYFLHLYYSSDDWFFKNFFYAVNTAI